MFSPRKESRPERLAYEESPCEPRREAARPWGRRAFRAGPALVRRGGGRRGGKAPFISRAIAQPLLLTLLLTLLFVSFHPLSSPVLAAGEVAPSWRWPARGEVICPFRPAQGPYGAGGHAGIDIALGKGSRVCASAAGTVSFAGFTPLGVCVSVVHRGGFKTTYVSLESAAVRRGQRVEAGQTVGASDGGRDPSSSSPHLHFGLFLNGVAIDPLPLLEGRLLDPEECLFLGPWEDKGAVEAYLSRHDSGGFFGWLGRGIKRVGRALGSACRAVVGAAGKVAGAAWGWTCRAARAVGGAFQAFYRTCIEPWFSPSARAWSRSPGRFFPTASCRRCSPAWPRPRSSASR